MEEKKGYIINDRRGKEPVGPVCRVCASKEEHSKEYNHPTMECIRHLRTEISEREAVAHKREQYIKLLQDTIDANIIKNADHEAVERDILELHKRLEPFDSYLTAVEKTGLGSMREGMALDMWLLIKKIARRRNEVKG